MRTAHELRSLQLKGNLTTHVLAICGVSCTVPQFPAPKQGHLEFPGLYLAVNRALPFYTVTFIIA